MAYITTCKFFRIVNDINAFNFVMAFQISFKFVFSLFNHILFNIEAQKCQLFPMLMKMDCNVAYIIIC